MPKSAGLFNDEEFFEIQDFIQTQNTKIKRLQHKAWVNRNKVKLNKYWERWHGRPLTKVELHTFAAGTDDPLGRESEFKKQIKDFDKQAKAFRKKKDFKNYRKFRDKKKRVGVRQRQFKGRAGKNLDQLMEEYEGIKNQESFRSGFLSSIGRQGRK